MCVPHLSRSFHAQLFWVQCVDTVARAPGRASGLQKTEWWSAGVVICLERGVDLHMAQMMPLPLTVSCFSKIQIVAAFLVPAHPGSRRQRAIKRRCVCVCDSTPTSPPLKLWRYTNPFIIIIITVLQHRCSVSGRWASAVTGTLNVNSLPDNLRDPTHYLDSFCHNQKTILSHSTCMNSTLGTVQLHTIQIHYRLRHGQLGPDKLFICLLHPKAAHNTSQLQIQRNTHAAHAHTTAAHSAVTPMPCHLHLVSLSAPHLKICPPA